MLYKPTNCRINENNIIDANDNNNIYYAQVNCRKSKVYGYELTIYDKQGNVIYQDTEMQALNNPAVDGEVVGLTIPPNVLQNDNDYQISVRFYNEIKGSQNKYDTEITKGKIKGSTQSMLWVRVALDEELRGKILASVSEYQSKDLSGTTYDYRREVARALADGLLDNYSQQIKDSTTEILINLDSITNINTNINTILELRRKEILDNIKYDRYIQIDVPMEEYSSTLIIPPPDKEEGVELPKTDKLVERRKITWTETYDDWLYIELDMSETNEETKGLTYSLTDQTNINIYEVSGINTTSSFFCDLAIGESTVNLGDYVLIYDSPESALRAHNAGDLPGNPYKVTPVYKNAYKVIGVSVDTGEIRVDGVFPQIPKVGYCPRFFTYDSLTETYTESHVGLVKKNYKVPGATPYFDIEGGLAGSCVYKYWDEPVALPPTTEGSTLVVPYNDGAMDVSLSRVPTEVIGKYKSKFVEEAYILEYNKNEITWVEYTAPSPFKICSAAVLTTYGYFPSFMNLDSNYVLKYSIDGGTNWEILDDGTEANKVEAGLQSGGMYSICLRGAGETGYCKRDGSRMSYNYIEIFSDDNNVSVKGNLDYLWACTLDPTTGDPIPFTTSPTHTEEGYAQRMFYLQNSIVDVSGLVYPESRTTNCFKDLFYKCGSIQKYPKNTVVYLTAEEALEGLDIDEISSVTFRHCLRSNGIKYTETEYNDGDMASKFTPLTDKRKGMVFVDGKPYIYENIFEVQDAQTYIFREYDAVCTIVDTVKTGTTKYEKSDIVAELKNNIKNDTGLTGNVNDYSKLKPYENSVDMYYDSRCQHKKGKFTLNKIEFIKSAIATVLSNEVSKFDEYYLKTPSKIDVYAFTPYYAEEECITLLGETGRWFTGEASRVSTYVGKLILEDESTVYIKLESTFKVPTGTELYLDDKLKTFSKTVDYSDIYLSASIGSGYIGHTDDVSNSDVIEGVINENGIKYEITSTNILKNGNAIKDNFGLTQLRYSCGRLVGLSNNKIYTSRDGINWFEDTIVTNASKLLTAEDTIVVLATDGTYISVDGTNWNKIDKVATDVAFAFGMFHLLIGDIVYSTTNFINFINTTYTSPTNICGTPFGLFVISSSNVKYVTQEKTIDIVAPTTLTNPIVYPVFGEQAYIYTDLGIFLFDGETITTTTLTSKKLHNNYSEYINITYDETVSAISTSDSWTAIEADVVDYRTLRYNEQYFNNSTTMILKGPIVCKDGHIAGAEYYDILTEDISVYNKVVFFKTPQRNIISSGGNMYSDIQKTELIGPIPLNCEYQIIDLSTSSVYDKNNKRLGYCDTPLTNNPMIEGTELFDDMDLKHNVGKYVPQYNVKCFLDVKEITDIIPLATRSDETTLPRIEFVDESFSVKYDSGSGQVVTLHNGVLLVAGDATTGIRYEGNGDYYITVDGLSNILMYVYDCLGDWSLINISTGKKIEPTYRYLVLETTQDGAGNLIYTYHEIDQPSKCISGNTLVFPVTYTLTENLKKYNKIIYPYKLDTNSIMTCYVPKVVAPTIPTALTTDWGREKYVLQNGIHKKAKGWYKETQSSYLNIKETEIAGSQYTLNSNKWNYYNDDWATVYADIGGNNSKYLYIPIPESGTTKEALNVYGVEYGVDGTPSKGYIHIDGKLYRVRGSSIVEDTGTTMIDIQKYQEQIIGGNPIEVVKDTKIESNNKERLFITPNINIKDDTTNPMQIIFNNDTRFGVTELDRFGDILLIENKGVIPYDENENIYPGCEYRVNTCFIDQDPTHRFTCKSKPDIVIKQTEGLGVNLVAEVREDIRQNLGNLTYHWEIREDFGWAHEGNIIYNEDIYNNNKLHINTLYEGRYYVSCTVNGVKTADLLIKVAYPIDEPSEPILSDESGLGYLIYPNPDYPHIYKRKHIYGISYTVWNPEDFYYEYLGKYTDQSKSLIDYDVALNTEYDYMYADDNNNTILYYAEPIERSNFVLTNLKDTFEFAYNYTAGSVTLNIDHTLSDSLSKYGKVTIKDKWYHSGTLSSLLGYISEEGYSESETFGEYKDMLIRWKKFAARGDILLYRTPKGDKYYVKITESPTYTINDITKIRETKVDFNWTEVENNTNFHELVDLKYGLKFANISSVKLENNWKGDGIVYYSLDAFNWEKWNGEEITANTVYFRGTNNTGTYGSKFIATPSNNGDNGGFTLAGNMDYLLDYESNSVICGDCHDLFRGSDVEDASDLTMSYNLTSGAYKDMFRDCTKLEKLPKLIAYPAPAGSYTDMFNGCTAITWTTKGNIFKILSNEDSMFTNCGFDTDATMPASGIPVAGQMYTYVPTRNKKFITLSSADEFTFDTLEGWCGEGSIQYSTDTYKWYTYNYGEPSVQCSELKEYNNKHELYIRGIGNTYTRYSDPYTSIVLNCESTVDMRGDFNDMLDYTTRVNAGNCPFLFCNQPLGDLRGFVMEVGDGEYSSYYSVFEGCKRMTYAPDKISFRGKIPDWGLEYMFYECISLLNAPEFEFLGEKTVGEWACCEMFYGCTSLTTVPDSVLSATTVEEGGYCGMFSECISLTEAPDIMTITIEDEGCSDMFYGTGIVIAPKIYATTIGMWCYYSMFENCESLTTPPPILLATTLEKECYCRMFRGCCSLTSLPELSALSLNESCYKEMFEDCTSLTTVPVNYLPVITLWVNCYDTMFKGCTLLNTAPNLPGEILQTECYNSMFANCKALVVAPTISATQLAESCCSEMFLGCSSLTTFNTDLSGLELKKSCYKSMFSGTALTSVPSLSNASTTEQSCYESMFENCSGLTTLPMDLLPATVVAVNAYYSMFKDCVNLTNIPNLPAVGLNYACYRYMFSGCSNLVSASINLPSTSVSTYGYHNMFYNCISLTIPPTMDAESLGTYACTQMFQNCYSLESPIDMSNVSNIGYGACQNMYTNCTSIKYPSNLKQNVTVSSLCCQNMYSGCSKIVWYPYGKPFTITTSATVNAPFNSMFSGNTFLSDVSHTTPAENTTYYLFDEDTVNYITLENKSTSTEPYTFTPHYMMYKVEGEEWKYASSATGIITVPYNKKVYLSGNYGGGYGVNGLKITGGEIYVSGYISAMVGQPSGHSELRKSVISLFYNSTGLVDASGLILGDIVAYSPSYNMTYAYASLFRGCENLVRGPVSLPEANGEGAYNGTFYYCKSLTNTPSITLGPTIYKNSYNSTFYCCTNLVDPPSVTFTGTGNRIVIEENGFKYMFGTCTKMTGDIFITSGGTVLYPSSIYKQGCYSMYRDCTSLSSTHFSFPDATGVIKEEGCAYMFTTTKLTDISGMSLSCMDVSEGAYQYMFRSCQVLETAMSNLPATTMKSNLYRSMFSSCYKLKNAPSIAGGTTLIDVTNKESVFERMFEDCKVLQNPAAINITALGLSTFAWMYSGCKNLTTVPNLSNITSVAEESCMGMFYGAIIKTQATVPSATTLATECYYCMYYRATFTNASYLPTLPATTLAAGCYESMFKDASGVKPIPLPATVAADNCYKQMFRYCRITWGSTGTAYCLPISTIAYDWSFEMFGGNDGSIPEGDGTPKPNTNYYYTI